MVSVPYNIPRMTDSLFSEMETATPYQPLAARLRPRSIAEFVGQSHLLDPGRSIHEAIVKQQPHSMILWGPPGVGKTTLARVIAAACDCHFESLSAVLAGVKDIRETIERARYQQINSAGKTLLFVDEVHRFNKAQQDAFLPHIEDGTVLFIGATTENPAFELNNALLSRARVYLLQSLTEDELLQVIDQALTDTERGLGALGLALSSKQKQMLAQAGDGDARRTLNYLEILSDMAQPTKAAVQGEDIESGQGLASARREVNDEHIAQVLAETSRRFDKGGDYFYDQISALHKAVRGSSPDGALYWLTRMLDGGCDPIYLARRLTRMASEDIGLADPRALQLCLDCWDSYVRLGSPEGDLALAHAAVYLASAPKSNAVYVAFAAARTAVTEQGTLEVPKHLRNAPTSLAKELGHGAEYRYAHDEDQAYAAGENYLPEAIKDTRFYFPADAGLELRIKEKMEHFRKLDKVASSRRYEDLEE